MTRAALRVWAVLIVLFLLAPIALILLYAFNPSNVQSWPLGGLSTKWFSSTWHNDVFVIALTIVPVTLAQRLTRDTRVLRRSPGSPASRTGATGALLEPVESGAETASGATVTPTRRRRVAVGHGPLARAHALEPVGVRHPAERRLLDARAGRRASCPTRAASRSPAATSAWPCKRKA